MRVREQFQRAIGADSNLWQWLTWALSLWLSASASAGLAEPPRRLAVLSLESDRLEDDAVARRLMRQVRAVVAERRELVLHETQASLAQLSIGQGCTGEGAECLAKVCRQLGVDGVLSGRIQHEAGASVIQLARFDAQSGAIVGSGSTRIASGPVADAQLRLRARELLSEALDFARTPQLGAAPLAARAAEPGAQPLAARYAAADRGELDARRITGYALLGGAVVSTGLSVLSWVQIDRAQSNDSFAAYRRSVGQLSPGTRDVCDEARTGQSYGLPSSDFARVKSSCSAGKTFEVLQYVFLGGAVVSGGLSAFLLFGGESSERPRAAGRLTLHPSVQRRGASLGARIAF